MERITGLKNRDDLRKDFHLYENGPLAILSLEITSSNPKTSNLSEFSPSLQSACISALTAIFGIETVYFYDDNEILILLADADETQVLAMTEQLQTALRSISEFGSEHRLLCTCGYILATANGPANLRAIMRAARMKLAEIRSSAGTVDGMSFLDFPTDTSEDASEQFWLSRFSPALDPTTGLPTMSAFITRFEDSFNVLANMGQIPAVVYFNVINLKNINEKFGFSEGDNVLRLAAGILSREFAGQLVSRFAEDHFVVLTSREEIEKRILRVRDTLRSSHYGRMGIKAGIYIYSGLEENIEVSTACDRAKLACDSIRKNYNANFCIYSKELKKRQDTENFVLENFNEALKKHYIDAWYQPIIRTVNRRIVDIEALCRWIDPVKGFISPADFIPVLEEYQLIEQLDMYMLNRVCSGIAKRRAAGEPLIPVSVNISRLDFELNENLLDDIIAVTKSYGIERSLLRIEITESTLSGNVEFMKRQMSLFREAGFKLWMDDFGCGYSSFNTLDQFRFDTIKLDMMFMRNFKNDSGSHVILKNLISMIKDLKLMTVAEGVETDEQYDFLSRIGCDFVQGFLFSPAVPLERIIGLSKLEVNGFETASQDHAYYDDIGRINMQHPAVDGLNEGIYKLNNEMPVAIIEYANNKIRYLRSGPAYRHFLNSIHIKDEQESERLMNDMSRRLSQGFHAGIQHTIETNQWESMDFVEGTQFCTSHAHLLAKNEKNGSAAVFFICLNITNFGQMNRADLAFSTVRPMLTLYSRIDLLSIHGDFIQNLYCNSQRYAGKFDMHNTQKSILDFARLNILENQQEAFIRYYDMSTAKKRLLDTHGHHLASIFDTRQTDGTYEPQLYLLTSTRQGNTEMILSCLRDFTKTDYEAFEQLQQRDRC